jgi:hypothetical protein
LSTNLNDISPLDRLADSYVRLVLSVGLHDSDYVDAYYGSPHLKVEVEAEKPSLPVILRQAKEAHARSMEIDASGFDEMTRLRHQYLTRQLDAVIARIRMLSGATFTFDEESRALYDAVAPTFPESHFQKILEEIASLLPGQGPVPQRFEEFKKAFIIPREKLDSVFQAAITESRKRTRQYIDLPADETFVLEYVTGKSWSGYNWYKGNSYSLIQINTDFPIAIDRAIDLASHEGYPGHHVYNALLERDLVRERKWMEFTVYPLFSPQSLIAEGTANFGIEMAFPGEERVEFERNVLFPRGGLDGSRASEYYKVHALFLNLNYAGNEAARGYLDGTLTRDEAVRWLVDYALFSPERAQQRTRFFDQYRSYVINYNLGQDLVGRYIASKEGATHDVRRRWAEFQRLLASPRLPSGLAP